MVVDVKVVNVVNRHFSILVLSLDLFFRFWAVSF